MKKIIIAFLTLTSILFTSCEKQQVTIEEGKLNQNQKKDIQEKIQKVKNEIEVIEIKTESENTQNNERIKSQKEMNFPERFNPTTGESVPKPY